MKEDRDFFLESKQATSESVPLVEFNRVTFFRTRTNACTAAFFAYDHGVIFVGTSVKMMQKVSGSQTEPSPSREEKEKFAELASSVPVAVEQEKSDACCLVRCTALFMRSLAHAQWSIKEVVND